MVAVTVFELMLTVAIKWHILCVIHQANSASYPQWDGNWVPATVWWCSVAGQ